MIEQPGKLYLGNVYDLGAQERTDAPFMLSFRDMIAGAGCVGGHDAGKVNLGACMLEEALLQAIPAIVVDTKGELAGLARRFNEAHGAGATHHHAPRAEWAEWGMDTSLAQTLAGRATFQIYTPGSEAGQAPGQAADQAIGILHSLTAPDPSSGLTWAQQADALRAHIALIVSALLELAEIESAPGQGLEQRREHILLSALFESAWRAALPVNMELLIRMIEDPPLARIGAFDMNAFYPKVERSGLAIALSRLAASPSFTMWQAGEPLDIASLLKPLRDSRPGMGGTNPAGRTRASIFNLSHLNTAEQRFFVTLLIAQLLLWMRAQAGTSVPRCLLSIDEVAGLSATPPGSPPDLSPGLPAGLPALAMALQQGRASGVGALVAAQDIGALDFHELAGMGTWLVGGFRTAREQLQALEGLERAGAGVDRDELEPLLSRLPEGVFLALNAHGLQHVFKVRPAILRQEP